MSIPSFHKAIALVFAFLPFVHVHSQFQLNGTAVQLDSACYRLTQAIPSQAGSMWSLDQIDLSESFDLNFDIFLGCDDFNGADGMYFALQPISTSIGTSGGGMGYSGINPSLGIEFDTYTNGSWSDPSADHVSIMRNGNINHSTADNLAGPVNISPFSINVEDCMEHNIRITWDAVGQTIEVYFDCEFRVLYTGDIINDIFGGDPMVFYGFTSGTGALDNEHRVCLTYFTELNQLEDQNICIGDSIQLEVPEGFESYEWSPGIGISDTSVSNPVFYPEMSTGFNVVITDDCGFQIFDSVFIEVSDQPMVDLGDDFSACSDESVILNAEWPGANYSWQDGSLDPEFEVTSSGIYWVDIGSGTCSQRDSIDITIIEVPIVDLGPDRTLCEGENAVLAADFAGSTVLWNTGETNFEITVEESGTYSVILDNDGCLFEDSVQVDVNPTPSVNLGNDTTLCLFEVLVLDASNENASYQWQDLSTGSTLLVDGEGVYMVDVTIGDCSESGSIVISYEECECNITFPNAFSPNQDGINDVFKQFGCNSVSNYVLRIYNRWGEAVYEGRDPLDGWNGVFNGADSEIGTYVWQVRYKPDNNPTRVKTGNITLIR